MMLSPLILNCALTHGAYALMHGVRSALLPPDPDTDPNVVMAQQFATQHGFHIAYRRDINCPNALFNKYEGVFLVMLEIRTGAGSDVDRHYITYLAATGQFWTTSQVVRYQS